MSERPSLPQRPRSLFAPRPRMPVPEALQLRIAVALDEWCARDTLARTDNQGGNK